MFYSYSVSYAATVAGVGCGVGLSIGAVTPVLLMSESFNNKFIRSIPRAGGLVSFESTYILSNNNKKIRCLNLFKIKVISIICILVS